MLGRKVESTRPASLVEVRKILEERSGEPDFGYEQQTSLDYARKFAKLTPQDAAAMENELADEISALRPEAIAKFVDILPTRASTLGAIVAKERISLSPAQMAKAQEIIAKYRERMIAPPEPAPAPETAEGPAPAGTEAPAPAASEPAADEGKSKAKEAEDKPAKKAKSEKAK